MPLLTDKELKAFRDKQAEKTKLSQAILLLFLGLFVAFIIFAMISNTLNPEPPQPETRSKYYDLPPDQRPTLDDYYDQRPDQFDQLPY